MQQTNAERRQILRAQHAALRGTIERARGIAADVLAGEGLVGQLQFNVIALERELLAHLRDEELLLAPVLAQVDAWGALRVSLLRAEHAHQRAVLAVLTGQEAWPASSVVAKRTIALCDDLLLDMQFEERELLDEKLLRDDTILLDASDC